jgi:AcrR family transcriptional regulator
MNDPSSKRPYRKRRRAQSEEETRRRITEAAVELHGTVGPANTKMTELAERAGVSRMTVYNHFPTEADLFAACSSHWASQNPFPDPSGWTDVADPRVRLVTGLEELYGWYGSNQGMLENVLRDAYVVPSLGQLMDDFWGGYMKDVVRGLAHGWSVDQEDTAAFEPMLRVVVDFNTWQLLTRFRLNHRAAAQLAAGMVTGAVASPVAPSL